MHAKKMFAHFETDHFIDQSLIYKLNSFLSEDVAVQSVFPVKAHFHARFDATFRTYEYYISTEKNPFTSDFAWQIRRGKLDLEKMNAACKILFEFTDFTSFAKLHADNKTNNCKIYKAVWEENETDLKFTISADRFLRNMVRAIVGTMVDVGAGKTSLIGFKKILEAENRSKAGTSSPPQGLFLVDVGYDFE